MLCQDYQGFHNFETKLSPRPVYIHQLSNFLVSGTDLEDTLKILEFILNLIEKVKPGLLLSSMCMFPESNGTKFEYNSFHLQNSGILQTRIDQKGDPMKLNFDNFQM